MLSKIHIPDPTGYLNLAEIKTELQKISTESYLFLEFMESVEETFESRHIPFVRLFLDINKMNEAQLKEYVNRYLITQTKE